MKAVVAICTHNPNPEKLHKVLSSIALNKSQFRVMIIDNASSNRDEWDFQSEFGYSLIIEPHIGNAHARFRALVNCKPDELVIFVDDDNFIAEDYIETALKLSADHPDWGCFGGQQIPSTHLVIPRGRFPLLPYLGIRSLGNAEMEVVATFAWNQLEPIGAGMCISPAVVNAFLNSASANRNYFFLGRSGKRLLSGEDSFIARTSAVINLKWGYSPKLVLTHDIRSSRLNYKYLTRLLFNYGLSDVLLEKAISGHPISIFPRTFREAALAYLYTSTKYRGGWVLGLRHFGQYVGMKQLVQKGA